MANNAFGDFQTPKPLVALILEKLQTIYGKKWGRILEPTCGVGNFISGILNSTLLMPHAEIHGIEIQASYLNQAIHQVEYPDDYKLHWYQANVFELDLAKNLRWGQNTPLLVLGNPPWVTNADLGSWESDNHPSKYNIASLSGLDALTGASNFDLTEFIWLKLMSELAAHQPTIALLCKTSVARNVLRLAAKKHLPVMGATLWEIDTKAWFGASVDACLLLVDMGTKWTLEGISVYKDLEDLQPAYVMGFEGEHLIGNRDVYREFKTFDGICRYEWRQGVKHDFAPVMELSHSRFGGYENKWGEKVDIEEQVVYPLLKSTDLYHHTASFSPRKSVIITQNYIGEDTTLLMRTAPKLWAYLSRYEQRFAERKSKIYQGKPPFSMFGIGDYTFSPYKVALSGLHKSPRFIGLGMINQRPIILDDTCYFIAFQQAAEAAIVASLLNMPITIDFLTLIAFQDAKRPFTKKLLQRLHIPSLFQVMDKSLLIQGAESWYEQMTDGHVDIAPIHWEMEVSHFMEDVLEQKPLL